MKKISLVSFSFSVESSKRVSQLIRKASDLVFISPRSLLMNFLEL